MIAGVAAFAAWLGVSLIVVGDGRRALAAGLAVTALALAVVAWSAGAAIGAAALAAGGLMAATLRLRSGPAGWDVLPGGSTPRLVMCMGAGFVALWIAAAVMTGGGAALRFAVLSTVGLAGGRVMIGDEVAATTTSVAALVLGLAVATAVDGVNPGFWTYVVAAAVAVAVSWFPRTRLEPG